MDPSLTVSTLKPMVGMVVTTSPSLSLYKMVVLPVCVKSVCVCVCWWWRHAWVKCRVRVLDQACYSGVGVQVGVFVHASAFVRARAGVGVYAKGVSVSMHVCARACVRGYPRHRGRPSKYASPSCRLGRAREGRGER